MKIIWSVEAISELNGINGYLHHPGAGKRMIQAIRRRVRLLSLFPLSGRMIPEIGDPALREVVVGQFRVLHRVDDRVEILHVVDGHTLFDPSIVSEAVSEYGFGERTL